MASSDGVVNKIAFSLAILAVSCLFFLASLPIYAQVAGATLSGTITDPSGAAIPNAQVSIKNTATGVQRDVISDSAGFYSAPNLLPGSYDVTFSAPGFATLVRGNLTLVVGGQQQLNQVMQVGQINQTVEVTAEAPTVELTSSVLGAEVNSTTLHELPLNGRDWTQLATLQPGVVTIRTQAPTNSTAPRSNRGFGNQIAAVGHRPYENNYRVNGISINDYSNGAPGSVLGAQLGVDAIQEFSVLTSNYEAAYGRTSGGVINGITKSGTNQFHGTAYWFLRDEGLDARNYFDVVKPPFHRNQFGASGGAPIKKNRTFIFGDYEGIRQAKGITFPSTVPTAAARLGNLCSHPELAPSSSPCTPTTVTVDPLVVPYLPLWPLPNGGLTPTGRGDVAFFNAVGSLNVNEDYVTARGDHTFSDKDTLSMSWFYETSHIIQPDSLLLSTTASASKRHMASVEESHIFSATFTNTVRIGFNRSIGEQAGNGVATRDIAADKSLGILPGHEAPQISVTGLTPEAGTLETPPHNTDIENSFQAYDDVFLTRGTHSFSFGFAWEHLQYNSIHRGIYNGTYSFSSLTRFLTNNPTSLTLLFPDLPAPLGKGVKWISLRQTLFGGYVQDNWHARPNLTLNLGVRYEPTTMPSEAYNLLQGLPDLTSGPVPMQNTWQTNQTLRNVEPRVGFAWDPFHDSKTAVRGGFGIFDVLPLPWETVFQQATSFPFSVRGTINPVPAGDFPTGAVALLAFKSSNLNTVYYDQHPKRNYAMNWNFNIERQLSQSFSLMVGYAGSHTIHQPFLTSAKMVLPTLTSAGYLWPCGPDGKGHACTAGFLPTGTQATPVPSVPNNTNVGAISGTFWDGNASYHGLQAQVVKRMSHGIQFQGSFTWSKCIDDGSSGHITDPFQNTIAGLLWFSETNRRGLCDFDIHRNFVANYLWQIPKPKFGGVAGEYLLGSWSLSGVLTASTGNPTTPTIAGDPMGAGGPTAFASRIAGPGCDNPVNPGNPQGYFKLSCFSPPTAPPSFAAMCVPAAASVAAVIPNTCMNLFGNAGRNSVIGPSLLDLDFSLLKEIPIRKVSDVFNVQFRAEFFNIFNHPNFQVPNGSDGNGTLFNQDGTVAAAAGVISSTTTDPREIQFGLKVIW